MPKRPEKYHQPYSDEDLITILSDAPTHANAVKYAARFQRTEGAIEMIFRWAMAPKETIKKRGRSDHAFILQIRNIAKKRVGWLT